MKKLKYIDWSILLSVLALMLIGSVGIYSAVYNENIAIFKKHIIFVFVSMAVIFTMAFIDYRKIINIAPVLYILGVISLIAVKFYGIEILGSKRWIDIGIGTFQPSEFMKFVVILMTVYLIHTAKPPISIKDVAVVVLVVIIPFILVLKQPDLGTAVAIMFPVLVIIFLGEVNKKFVIGAVVLAILAMPYVYSSLKSYQKKRIMAFLNPEADPTGIAYQMLQSQIAVGSGGIFGKGFLQGTQSKLSFLPEKHNDFIFATISEEWGFVVSVLIVILFWFLSVKIFIWGRKVDEIPAKFICYGVGSIIFFQSFVNIGMTIGLAPVVGLTLPFLSYGGSSLLSFSLMIGVVLSIIRDYKERKVYFSS